MFEKLDEERISNLLANVCTDQEMQIFITDTNCKRLQEGLQRVNQQAQ
jgi:DNA replication and repair protein RecF